MLDQYGNFSHNVFPFDSTRYLVTVHPAAALVFAYSRDCALGYLLPCETV